MMCAFESSLILSEIANSFQSYYPVTQAKGEVGNNAVDASVNTVCTGTDVQSLCCAPGTTLGTCGWEGWNGVGMSCSVGCANDSAIAIAENSKHSRPGYNQALTSRSQPLHQVLSPLKLNTIMLTIESVIHPRVHSKIKHAMVDSRHIAALDSLLPSQPILEVSP